MWQVIFYEIGIFEKKNVFCVTSDNGGDKSKSHTGSTGFSRFFVVSLVYLFKSEEAELSTDSVA